MKTKLSPCPFCGGEAVTDSYEMVPFESLHILDNDGHWYYVFCSQCFARAGENISMEKAIEAWNRRYKAE